MLISIVQWVYNSMTKQVKVTARYFHKTGKIRGRVRTWRLNGVVVKQWSVGEEVAGSIPSLTPFQTVLGATLACASNLL